LLLLFPQFGKRLFPEDVNGILLRNVNLADVVRELRIDNHRRWHFCQPHMVNVVMNIADQLSRAAFIVTADLSTDEAEMLDQISPTKFDLFRRIKALNEDETAVLAEVLNFALEGLERGRHRYGPLVLERDNRDFLQEAREELRDGGIYIAAAKLKANRGPSGI
jgi:Zn-finger domain-containing protein